MGNGVVRLALTALGSATKFDASWGRALGGQWQLWGRQNVGSGVRGLYIGARTDCRSWFHISVGVGALEHIISTLSGREQHSRKTSECLVGALGSMVEFADHPPIVARPFCRAAGVVALGCRLECRLGCRFGCCLGCRYGQSVAYGPGARSSNCLGGKGEQKERSVVSTGLYPNCARAPS